MTRPKTVLLLLSALILAGCAEGTNSEGANSEETGNNDPNNAEIEPSSNNLTPLDLELRTLLSDENITGDPSVGLEIPSINEPLSQLGMKLFYSKSLGGDMDSACVSCHHPSLGGADNLSLSVGVDAIEEDVLGPERRSITGEFTVPRNAPTTFNSALYRQSLFWDSRVKQLDSGIRTPDSAFATPTPGAGESLLVAQAKFPVTSNEEMKSEHFEIDSSNEVVRAHLAARIGGYDGGFGAASELSQNGWPNEFQNAFGSSESPETLITYDNIALALAQYEASQVFINNPWKNYLDGETTAISDQAKRGAILFFTSRQDGGGDCSRCHSGDLFSDEENHVVAFPQIGPGKGDGVTGDDDFGIARETGTLADRYKFRTPSLLNASVTAPYGHTGSYQSLRDVVRHYDQPGRAIDFFDNNDWCDPITDDANVNDCNVQFPSARTNTRRAQNVLNNQPESDSLTGIDLNDNEVNAIVSFIETLTDPCVEDRNCLAPWIPDATADPDNNQLNALDALGNSL